MTRARSASLLAPLFFFTSVFCAFVPPAQGKRDANRESVTLEDALDDAERQLDSGGDASQISERLHRTRGLNKDELRRLDLVDARCALLVGAYAAATKLLTPLHKSAPDDARIAEWYARALDGSGKGEAALPLLKELADRDKLRDGDSYWTLAQLERKGGQGKSALQHARLALMHPIVLQSEELDKEIHKFIAELGDKSK